MNVQDGIILYYHALPLNPSIKGVNVLASQYLNLRVFTADTIILPLTATDLSCCLRIPFPSLPPPLLSSQVQVK